MSTLHVSGMLIGVAVALTGCGGAPSAKAPKGVGGAAEAAAGENDRSMCEWKGKADVEASETSGLGAFRPNIRRVFKVVGDTDGKRKALICREVDTNLDGIKDVARTFNTKGEAIREDADTDYDGKIDVWINFVEGRIAEQSVDTNHDGKPDVWKYYVSGQLSRTNRDRNFDGRADTWEIYANGHIERIGIDEAFDGHVSRWDRDQEAREAASSGAKADAGATETGDGGVSAAANSTSDAGVSK